MIQTVQPLSCAGEARYEDGWREEHFAGLGVAFQASMPWYFRTIGSWVRELHAAGFCVADCQEPPHPETGSPLSLIWIGAR